MEKHRPQQSQEQPEKVKPTKTTPQSPQSPQSSYIMRLKELHEKIRQKKLYLHQLTDHDLVEFSCFFEKFQGTIPCFLSWQLSFREENFRRNYKQYRMLDLLPSSLTPKESSIKETFEKLQKKQCSLQAMTVRELGRYLSGLLKYEMKLAVPRVHHDEVREEIFMKYRQLKFNLPVRYYPGYVFGSAPNLSPLEIDAKYTYLEITAKRYSLQEMTLDELEIYSKGLQKYQWKLKIPEEHHSEVLEEIATRERREPRQGLQSEPSKKKWAFSSLLSCLGSPPKEAKLSEVESKSQNTYHSRPFEDDVYSEQEECSLLGSPPKQ